MNQNFKSDYRDVDQPIESPNDQKGEEVLRHLIRRKIKEKFRSSGNKEMNEEEKRQLREQIRRDIMSGRNNSIETQEPDIGTKFKTKIKETYKSVKKFMDPGPSHQYNKDNDRIFQEQIRIALELSRAYIQPNNEENLGAIGGDVEESVEEQVVCGICLEETINPFTYGCEHQFCVDCITTNLNTAIKEGLIESMKCPQPECHSIATQKMIENIVSKQMFERYENLLLKAAVGAFEDIVYCPIEDCGAIIEAEADIGIAQCYNCGHTFCSNCSKPYHGTSDCELTEDERKQSMQKYQDELIAEKLLTEETQNQLAIEAIQREEEEWRQKVFEEQQAIRLQEENEKEEYERQQTEIRRLEEERVRAEAQQRERERIEYQRMVRDREERERTEKAVLEERRREDTKSENTVRNICRPCPNCKSPIEKNGGCVHMTCTKCRYEFCWKCMGHWTGNGHICS